jgi:protein-S-isoprenylcysteine O-methyltransferase Ste14
VFFLEWWLQLPVFAIPIIIIIGLILAAAGLTLLVITNRLFATLGEGTLAPWTPTSKLVIQGAYAHVRNPMITGVITILLGESIMFGSWGIFLWCIFFLVGNHVYFVFSEEPGLIDRFGDQYLEYMQNVPRWLPRSTPWTPSIGDRDA